jgi:phosphatidylglycerol:prolipoprotein diacylglycerol transferase
VKIALVHPILFEIAGRPVHAFGLMLSLAFLAGGLLMHADFRRKGVSPELGWWIVLCGLAGGLIGARLHLALTSWDAVAADPLGFLAGRSGLVWYGGLLGGIAATAIPIRRFRVPWLAAADTAAPALALGLAIGRIGCHLAGDGDWGTPTRLPWGVAYTQAFAGWPHPEGVRVHPAALYEMAALLAIAAGLWSLRARLRPDGSVFFAYLALAGVARFAVEFVRTNSAIALGLSEAQWTSLAAVAIAGAWLRRRARDPRPAGRAAARRR